MIITRDGAKLQCVPESGIGPSLIFSHTCERECDAEAWRVLFERCRQTQAAYDSSRERDRLARLDDLEARIATLTKSNAALRGCLRREKRRRAS